MTKRLSDLPAVARFRVAASEYCALLDQHAQLEIRDFLERLEQALPALVCGVLALPTISRCGPEPPERDYVGMFRPLHKALAEYLGDYRFHWRGFDPTEPTADDPLAGDLADDLTDIYCDLRRGLDPWTSADSAMRREIIWSWRFDYESHWGRHLVEALAAIYNLLGSLKIGRSTGPTEDNAETDA